MAESVRILRAVDTKDIGPADLAYRSGEWEAARPPPLWSCHTLGTMERGCPGRWLPANRACRKLPHADARLRRISPAISLDKR